MEWHSIGIDRVLEVLQTSENGLTLTEVENRLKEYGPNEIEEKGKSILWMFSKQFLNSLILILLLASLVSFFLGEKIDAIIIVMIVLLMGIMGFAQEYSAEKTIESLKELASPTCIVVRNGREMEVQSSSLVPGDLIVLREGDRVPADSRLIYSEDLEVDESSLTGESVPVEKEHDVILPEKTPLAERKNMVFTGTYVTRGKAKAVVVATGMRTEMGKIAKAVSEEKEERTPLENELEYFARRIGLVLVLICLVVFLDTIFITKESVIEAALLAIALAVAAIPEGLPAIATAILALGARRMSRRNALVRKLSAVETLGACDVICSDKTGTMTKGEMTVRRIAFLHGEYEVTGTGYDPTGEVLPAITEEVRLLAELSAMHCATSARIENSNGKWIVKGSPTEGSALVFSMKVLGKEGVEEIQSKNKLLREYPFDRFRKRKSTIHASKDSYVVVVSGAPESVLEKSTKAYLSGKEEELTDELREEVTRKISYLASKGYRTFSLAYKVVNDPPKTMEDSESELVFLSVMGIIDPPREGVRESIETCKRAGIRVIMITGDHKLTAMAIANEIGMNVSEDEVITGEELEEYIEKGGPVNDLIEKKRVYARVTPEHKAIIVKALKENGHTVAMTGDGVNDAPALKAADIGVAMGIRGTQVARESSQLILLDDNFSTIVEAIKEGRVIFDNLKKPINFLLTCNLGEVAAIFGAELLKLPLILKPIQVLWVNVTTDALPAIALGLEPPEKGIMERPPRKNERLINKRKLTYYTIMGTLLGVLLIFLFKSILEKGLTISRTVVFTSLVMAEFSLVLSNRSENSPVFNLKRNIWIWPAILFSLVLQMIVVYHPRLNEFFYTEPLPAWTYSILLFPPAVVFIVNEVRKLLGLKI